MNMLRLLAVLFCISGSLQAAQGVTQRVFGRLPDGQPVTLYGLSNSRGMRVEIMDYGATVVNLWVPDRAGKLEDIALGFDSFKPYLGKKNPYFGCTVGRYANRIDQGRFTLDGKRYQLSVNDGPHHLHGGKRGFDKHMWKGQVITTEPPTVRFSRISPDGEQGYPGTVIATVTYTLLKNNALRIDYQAETDAPTIVNLAHHTYFNLSGSGRGTILDHLLTLPAKYYTPVNDTLIPTGEIRPVRGTVMDFRKPKAIGLDLKAVGGKPVGYDHNWVLGKGPFGLGNEAAELYEPKSGRVLKMYSDQPGIQFYSGNFLDSTLVGKGGRIYPQYSGLCLEPQHFPDSPNQRKFPSTVLRPGQTYRTWTIYEFGVK